MKTVLLAAGAVLGLSLFGVTVALTTMALTGEQDAASVAASASLSPAPPLSPAPSLTTSPSPSQPPLPTPTPIPIPDSVPSQKPPAPSRPTSSQAEGFAPAFVFDEMGCAEVPNRVLVAVNENLPPGYRAVFGAASQYRGDSAVMSFYVERQDRFANYLDLNLYINSLGELYHYDVGRELVPHLPDYPDVLSQGNAYSMGLEVCSQSILGDVINE